MDHKYTPSRTKELKSIIFDIVYNNIEKQILSSLYLKKEDFFKKYDNLTLGTKIIIGNFFDEISFKYNYEYSKFRSEYYVSLEDIYDIISYHGIKEPTKLKEVIKNSFFSKFHKFFYEHHFNSLNVDPDYSLDNIIEFEKTKHINKDVIENILDYYISQIPSIFFNKNILIDFNVIDVSKINNFTNIFEEVKKYYNDFSNRFPGIQIQFDISKWDMSSAINLSDMFLEIDFNGDISNWDVSKVTDMSGMFYGSNFNGDISNWNVSNVISMNDMFRGSNFNGDISNWDVSKVTDMSGMFYDSDFNGDISHWNMKNVEDINEIFAYSKFKRDLTLWELDNLITMDNAFLGTELHFDISLWYTPKLKKDTSGLEYLYKYKFDVSEFYRYTKRKAKAKEYMVLSKLSDDEINKFGSLSDDLVYMKYLGYGYFVSDYYNKNDKKDLHNDVKQGIYNYYTNEIILTPKYDYIEDIDENLNSNIIIGRYKYSWNGILTMYYGIFNLNKKETITKIRYDDYNEIKEIQSKLEYELINNVRIRESNIDLNYIFNYMKEWESITEEIKVGKEESEKNLKRFEQVKEQISILEKELLEIKQKEEEKYNILKEKIEKQKNLETELKNKYNLNIIDALNMIKQAKDNDFDE